MESQQSSSLNLKSIKEIFVNEAPQIGFSKKVQPQKIGTYKIIDSPTLVTYKLGECSGEEITRYCSKIVPYYPKELFVQEQMKTYISENSLLGP